MSQGHRQSSLDRSRRASLRSFQILAQHLNLRLTISTAILSQNDGMIRKAKVRRPYTLQTSRQTNPDVTGSKKKGEKVIRSGEDRRDPIGEMNTDLAVDDEPTVLGGVVRRDLGQGVDLRIAPHLSLSLPRTRSETRRDRCRRQIRRRGWGGFGGHGGG